MPLMSWPGMHLRSTGLSGCGWVVVVVVGWEEEGEEEGEEEAWDAGERVSAHPSSPRQRAVVWIFTRYCEEVGVGVG